MSWFSGKTTIVTGRDGPSSSHSHSHSHRDDDRESRHSSHRDSHSYSHGSSKGETKAYFVRPHESSSRSSEPKAYFVRPHSPSAASGISRGFSIFGGGGKSHSSSSSSYRRRPRDGYVARLLAQLRRLWRDLLAFARRNPMKLVVMVVMPLLTGGALTKVLAGFGVRLPAGLGGLAGLGGGQRSGRGGPNVGGFGVGEALNIAKMFL